MQCMDHMVECNSCIRQGMHAWPDHAGLHAASNVYSVSVGSTVLTVAVNPVLGVVHLVCGLHAVTHMCAVSVADCTSQ
jgi:hypothetical protein